MTFGILLANAALAEFGRNQAICAAKYEKKILRVLQLGPCAWPDSQA